MIVKMIVMRYRDKMSDMRLTTQQRLETLERETVVLRETTKMLHKMLRQQAGLIHDYILQGVSKPNGDSNGPNGRPEDALYTFVCRKRFDNLEREVRNIHKTLEKLRFRLKAG